MMLEVALEADEEWDSSIPWGKLARAAAEAAVAESRYAELLDGKRIAEISIRLTGDEQVRALNAEWRGRDKPTNVLSFPLAGDDELSRAIVVDQELLLGDIVLARGICAAEAADKNVAMVSHAAHLIAHGTLHLLGYDHADDEAAAEMEAREVKALARLGIANPYEAMV